ncbi:hypothetical protein GJ496_000022 [Pomphorhynchus laevis]|nr:hypothetical protein GJ496_000022 [Pomphorhynchus laevis]
MADTCKLIILAMTIIFKTTLFWTYKSTDFEVHRNWIAITHQLPVNEWYTNNVSEWTLDYPPMFAYFEYFLSIFGNLVDRNMTTTLSDKPYDSLRTTAFQRSTVLICDVLFAHCVFRFTDKRIDRTKTLIFMANMMMNYAMILVDSILFRLKQINGVGTWPFATNKYTENYKIIKEK